MPRASASRRTRRSYDMTNRAAAAAQTQERIVTAAFELFLERGYDDVTLAKVARRAGVSTQTVVLRMGTKEGLVRAVIAHRRPREEAAREVAVGDVDQAARVICERYEEIGPATLRLLPLEDRIEAAAEILEVGRASHRAWVERTFGPVIRSRGAKRERKLVALVAAFDIYTWHVLRRTLDPEQTAMAMADLARGALGKPGSARSTKGGR